MVKLNNQPPLPVHDTAATLHVANSVAMALVTPQLPINMRGPQSPANAMPKTGGHPKLQKFQRSHGKPDLSDIRQDKFLHMVEALCKKCQEPMSVQELSGAVPGCVMVKDELRGSNDFFDIYISPRFCLPDSYVISEIEARVSTSDKAVKMVTLSLEDAYMQPATLKKQYGELNLQLPRDESPLEMISYTSSQPWGEIRFGYRQERPDLLASIVFDKNPA